MRKRQTITNPTKQSANGQWKAADQDANVTRSLIAAKAYELFEQRGRANGQDLDDWLKAEALVTDRQACMPGGGSQPNQRAARINPKEVIP